MNRNSQSTEASINRVSENKDWDKAITGINRVPSGLHVLNRGEMLLKIKFSIVYVCILPLAKTTNCLIVNIVLDIVTSEKLF